VRKCCSPFVPSFSLRALQFLSVLFIQQKKMARNWGELVREHEQRRTSLGWSREEQEPLQIVTRREVAAKECEFDPILQKFRQGYRETAVRESEEQRGRALANKGKLRAVSQGQHFDIINNSPSFPGTEATDIKRKQNLRKQVAGFHIISNLDLADHSALLPENRPDRMKENPRQRKSRRGPAPDVDIISNNYFENNEEKQKIDRKLQQMEATVKYQATRNFNPVTCSFYDSSKEVRFKEKRREMEKSHGSDFKRRLPPSIRNSEGMRSNILCTQDAESDRIQEEAKVQSLAAERERAQKEVAFSLMRLKERRMMNRVTPQRMRDMYGFGKGFDIITSKPFFSRHGVSKPAIAQAPIRETLWGKLESQS